MCYRIIINWLKVPEPLFYLINGEIILKAPRNGLLEMLKTNAKDLWWEADITWNLIIWFLILFVKFQFCWNTTWRYKCLAWYSGFDNFILLVIDWLLIEHVAEKGWVLECYVFFIDFLNKLLGYKKVLSSVSLATHSFVASILSPSPCLILFSSFCNPDVSWEKDLVLITYFPSVHSFRAFILCFPRVGRACWGGDRWVRIVRAHDLMNLNSNWEDITLFQSVIQKTMYWVTTVCWILLQVVRNTVANKPGKVRW